MISSPSTTCCILFCFNEEHIIQESVEHYLEQGIDVVVIDNGSTDRSLEIIGEIQDRAIYPGRIKETLKYETAKYEWNALLNFACSYMHKHLSHYDWIIFGDADAFYLSPVRNLSLIQFMEWAQRKGYNILDGILCEFYPTEKDDPAVSSVRRRMRFFRRYYPSRQHKILLYHPSIRLSEGGHTCNRDQARVFPIKFCYLHYPWVSLEHGIKKIFKERLPRYCEHRVDPRLDPQYKGMLPIEADLIKKSSSLLEYSPNLIQMSYNRFYVLIQVLPLITLLGRVWAPFQSIWKRLRYSLKLFIASFKHKKLHTFFLIFDKFKKNLLLPKEENKDSKFQIASYSEILFQKAALISLPQSFHFLVNNYCNARCTFCNQEFKVGEYPELDFKTFRVIAENIPHVAGQSFMFSGGGEPLLTEELGEIIRFVSRTRPEIKTVLRTNGLMLERRYQEILHSGLKRLEVSIHGSTTEKNQQIIQAKGNQDIFQSLALLNRGLLEQGKLLERAFYVAVSQKNIGDLPDIVRQAKRLGVNEVTANFTIYYPGGKSEESLYYTQHEANRAFLHARQVARSLNIQFRHPPLFFQRPPPNLASNPGPRFLSTGKGMSTLVPEEKSGLKIR